MAIREIEGSDRPYVDWAAVFAGTVVAVGVAVVMTTFAAALGLGAVSVDEDGGVSWTWLVVTALFVLVSMIAAHALGGYIAGRMRRPIGSGGRDEVTVRDGINGLTVWGLGMVVSAVMAGSIIGGGVRAAGGAVQTAVEATGSAIGGVAQGAGQAAAPALQDMMPDGMGNPLDYITDTLLRPDGQSPGQTLQQDAEAQMSADQRQLVGILANVVRTGEIPDEDRDWLRQQVALRTGLSETEVDARVNQAVERAQAIRAEAEQRLNEVRAEAERLKTEAQARLDEARDKAAEAAETARITGILSAFLLAAASLIAAAAAYMAAVRGGRDRDDGRVWGGLAWRE